MGVKRLRPLPVTVVEGDDFILVAQHLHADKTTEGGRIIQADYTDYGITIERIGTDKLSIYSLLNQTPLSDVVETTSRTAASLIDDELWEFLKNNLSIYSEGTQIELATATDDQMYLGLLMSLRDGIDIQMAEDPDGGLLHDVVGVREPAQPVVEATVHVVADPVDVRGALVVDEPRRHLPAAAVSEVGIVVDDPVQSVHNLQGTGL